MRQLLKWVKLLKRDWMGGNFSLKRRINITIASLQWSNILKVILIQNMWISLLDTKRYRFSLFIKCRCGNFCGPNELFLALKIPIQKSIFIQLFLYTKCIQNNNITIIIEIYKTYILQNGGFAHPPEVYMTSLLIQKHTTSTIQCSRKSYQHQEKMADFYENLSLFLSIFKCNFIF